MLIKYCLIFSLEGKGAKSYLPGDQPQALLVPLLNLAASCAERLSPGTALDVASFQAQKQLP